MTIPVFYEQGVSPALDIDDPGTAVLMGHTGTLMTDGHGNGADTRTGTLYGQSVELGPDLSAAAINPHLEPDLATLPDGYMAGPTITGPIY